MENRLADPDARPFAYGGEQRGGVGHAFGAYHLPLAQQCVVETAPWPKGYGDADFLLLWALKHDLLEFVPPGQV